MKRIAAIGAILALGLAAPSIAAAQPGPSAAEAAPSAHKLEMAKRILEATGMNSSMSGMMRNMVSQMMAKRMETMPAAQRAKAEVFEQAQADAMGKMIPSLVAGMTEQYARVYSDQELSDILAFYETTTGRSMVSKTPIVMQGMINLMVTDLAPKMMRDIGEEVCAKTTCTDAEKSAYFGATTPAKP